MVGKDKETLTSGDIIYFADREGYRNSRKENVGAHVQYPDYMVIDAKIWGGLKRESNYTVIGIPRKGYMITDSELAFFRRVGSIHSIDYSVSDIKKDPYYFSRLYASGNFCQLPIFLKSTLIGLSTYFPHQEKNIVRIHDLVAKREEEGLSPSELMEISLHMLREAYLRTLESKEGNVNEATKTIESLMVQTSRNMTKIIL